MSCRIAAMRSIRWSLLPSPLCRTLVVAVVFVFLTQTVLTCVASERGVLPNIVIILADDLGYGDLSSYGATDLRTPHIDALVESGMRFDSFYANCSVCSPTRASLMTGRYPELVGVPGVIRTHAENSWGYLSQDAVLLPAILSQAGYATAIVGKWHLGLEAPNRPTDRGFEFFHGFLGDMMDDYYTYRLCSYNAIESSCDMPSAYEDLPVRVPRVRGSAADAELWEITVLQQKARRYPHQAGTNQVSGPHPITPHPTPPHPTATRHHGPCGNSSHSVAHRVFRRRRRL